MKMIQTPTATASNGYTGYIHNCLRNAKCEPSWSAPLPGVPYLQLYVEYGTTKPVIVEFQLRDVCADTDEQIFPSNYVIGQTPEGNWYGVFKYFNTPVTDVTAFVVWHAAFVQVGLSLVEKTYFTQMLVIEPCMPLTKVKSCHPEGATNTGFDVNGIYYGLPVNEDFLGLEGVRYFHIAYVRLGKVKELSNKATFKSSLVANFRTTIEKIYQLETELVPQWYKNVLLAIYSRGAIQVNDGPAMLVSDLNFEPINDDDLQWKPYAQLKETFRLYYGCDDGECAECCSPVVLDADVVSEDAPSGSGSQSESGSASASEEIPTEHEATIIAEGDADFIDVRVNYGAGWATVDISPFTYPIITGSTRTGTYDILGATASVEADLVGSPGLGATVRLIDSFAVNHDLPWVGNGTYGFAAKQIATGFTITIIP